MDELIQPLEQAAEKISHKMTEMAKDVHQGLDGASAVDTVLEVGALVVEIVSSAD